MQVIEGKLTMSELAYLRKIGKQVPEKQADDDRMSAKVTVDYSKVSLKEAKAKTKALAKAKAQSLQPKAKKVMKKPAGIMKRPAAQKLKNHDAKLKEPQPRGAIPADLPDEEGMFHSDAETLLLGGLDAAAVAAAQKAALQEGNSSSMDLPDGDEDVASPGEEAAHEDDQESSEELDQCSWPQKKTFAGRNQPPNPKGGKAWRLKRRTFYRRVDPADWGEFNERLFWSVWTKQRTAEEALLAFMAEKK